MIRRLEPLLFGCIALFHSVFLHAAAAEYDLVIRNGKIVDGSGNPWFYGDVAIKRGRIASVGRVAGEATRVIDAAGLVIDKGTHTGARPGRALRHASLAVENQGSCRTP